MPGRMDRASSWSLVCKATAAILLLSAATACATHSKPVANKPIGSIAVIPAANPRWYTFENAAPPVGYPFQYWVNKQDSNSKAKRFNDAMDPKSNRMGADFTDEVVTALRGYGFTVTVFNDVPRTIDDPDNVDYDKVSTDADAILHLSISEVGLHSSHTSAKYVPRLDVSGKLFVKGQEDDLYSEDFCYGVDARKGKTWAIFPDPKFAYPSFDDVMSHADEIRSSFAVGALEIAQRMSEQISGSIQHANVVAAKHAQ